MYDEPSTRKTWSPALTLRGCGAADMGGACLALPWRIALLQRGRMGAFSTRRALGKGPSPRPSPRKRGEGEESRGARIITVRAAGATRAAALVTGGEPGTRQPGWHSPARIASAMRRLAPMRAGKPVDIHSDRGSP